MIYRFTIIGEPKPKQSARFCNAGGLIKSYQSAKVKANESDIRMQVLSQLPEGFELITAPIAIRKLHFVFSPLKTMKKIDLMRIEHGAYVYKPTKPDLTDNLSKGLFDALQGILYKNDSQIVSMDDVKKYYGNRPRIEIELEVLE
jgi:Holliday junction resolvase RusA-like endonuclease